MRHSPLYDLLDTPEDRKVTKRRASKNLLCDLSMKFSKDDALPDTAMVFWGHRFPSFAAKCITKVWQILQNLNPSKPVWSMRIALNLTKLLFCINALFSVNVFGLLLATKAALPLFTEEGGSIINTGSVIGEMAPAQASIYAGTKGALNSITRVFAKELASKKIRVNAVNPGAVHTEGFESAGFKDSPIEANMVQNTPLGRLGMPKDIADLVTYLASENSGWITGSLIDAAGGWR
jgi:hypothetical protein